MRQKTKKITASKKRTEKVALVVATFNEKITENLKEGALKTLLEMGFQKKNLDVFYVPGAFEIPLAALKLAKSKKYKGIICLGCVIRGGTPHFDYVCDAVTQGLTRVQLDTGIPTGFGVITTNNKKQAIERSSDDEYNKGRECVHAVVCMIDLLKKI